MQKATIFFILLIVTICSVKLFINSKSITRNYEISKIYFAPKSKIRIIVHSKSYVDENSDLGNGTAFVKLYQVNSKNDTVFLNTSPENIASITFRNKKIKFECSQMQKNKLFDYLVSIGFKKLDINEIAELRDVMTFINYGPKSTYLEGQTQYIKVLN